MRFWSVVWYGELWPQSERFSVQVLTSVLQLLPAVWFCKKGGSMMKTLGDVRQVVGKREQRHELQKIANCKGKWEMLSKMNRDVYEKNGPVFRSWFFLTREKLDFITFLWHGSSHILLQSLLVSRHSWSLFVLQNLSTSRSFSTSLHSFRPSHSFLPFTVTNFFISFLFLSFHNSFLSALFSLQSNGEQERESS